MQTEDRQACAACGAANRVDAASCWQCFAAFGAAATPPPPGETRAPQRLRPGFPPPMPVQPAVAPAVASAGAGRLVAVAVAIVAAVGGFLLVQRVMGGGGVELPETLAGFERRHDRLADDADVEMERALAGFDVSYDTAIYGTGPVPDFIVVLVEGRSLESTDVMFDQFVAGLTQAGAEVVSDEATADLDDTPHRCVGLRVQGTGMGACSWQGDDAAGFILALDGNDRSTEALLVTIWPELQAS